MSPLLCFVVRHTYLSMIIRDLMTILTAAAPGPWNCLTGSRSGGVNGPKGHLLRVECSAASVFSEIGMLVFSPGASAMFPTGSFCGELCSQGGGAALEGS